jgi:hypothetical protein
MGPKAREPCVRAASRGHGSDGHGGLGSMAISCASRGSSTQGLAVAISRGSLNRNSQSRWLRVACSPHACRCNPCLRCWEACAHRRGRQVDDFLVFRCLINAAAEEAPATRARYKLPACSPASLQAALCSHGSTYKSAVAAPQAEHPRPAAGGRSVARRHPQRPRPRQAPSVVVAVRRSMLAVRCAGLARRTCAGRRRKMSGKKKENAGIRRKMSNGF